MGIVEKAFEKVDRQDFIPRYLRDKSSLDLPLPIGFGQTISQPSTVYQMLQWLEAKSGEKVMDIGSGSGWTTALLSFIVGLKGKVFAVERIPELLNFGRENCEKLGIKNVQFFISTETYGLPDHSPFDRILVSASAKSLPTELINQLKIGGKLVIPVRNDILEITKTSKTKYKIVTHPGFIFVPLV
jgi:protein-L-isoaspartate(D-aspartate) O-methyltransferase